MGTALAADTSTESVALLAAFDSEWLYQIVWTDHIRTLIERLSENGGTILAASCEDGRWSVRLLFADREALRRTYEHCTETGLRFDVQQIYQLTEAQESRYGLTDKQRKTLIMAFEHGYYEIPRGTNAQDLADKRGISHQALSEQLRRAHGTLVGRTVIAGTESESRGN